jgi:hypothetical protein
MIDELTEKLKQLCEESAARPPLKNRRDVQAAFPLFTVNLDGALSEKLKSLIRSSVEGGLSTNEVSLVERQFAYQDFVFGVQDNWSGVARALRFPFSAGTFLKPLDQDCWPEAIDVARALLVFHPLLGTLRGRYKNVAEAAKRVVSRGFRLKVKETRFEFDDGELERATGIFESKISELGMSPFLSNIFGLMGTPWEPYEGMYMVPRDYTSWERPPSIPFSFLINLALRAPLAGQDLADPNLVWKEIIAT